MSTLNSEELFPLLEPEDESSSYAVKWQVVNSKYEIYSSTLKDLELSVLLPHCLEVKNKVEAAVGTAAHRGPSLYKVLPRTLSSVLRTIWEQILEDNVPPNEDIESFDASLRSFVASFATQEDRHELIQQLRSPKKALKMTVQQFLYRLQEINTYVAWLPGTEAALTADQLKQSFYDGMPDVWKGHFIDAGNTVNGKTRAELSRYFRQQEKKSRRKMIENERRQRRDSSSKSVRKTSSGSPKFTSKRRISDAESTTKRKSKSSSLPDDADCPVHPDMDHKWGKCFSNPDNRNKRRRTDGKTPSGSGNSDSSSKKTKSKGSGQYAIQAAKRKRSDESETTSSFESLNLQDSSSGSESGECFFAQDFSILNDRVIFSQTPSIQSERFERDFLDYARSAYAAGIDTPYEQPSLALNPISQLRLRPIGLMTVKKIQGHRVHRPLRVLFDPGSDSTFINRSALPIGANGKKTDSVQVSTINGVDKVNREVVLEGLTLPEFSPTQRIDKPINAYVFDTEARYDIILGLDVLVPLGIDVQCKTQTLQWNDIVIPWKSSRYFNDTLLTDPLAASAHALYVETDPLEEYLDQHFSCYYLQPEKLKESLYEVVPTTRIVESQQHLSQAQQQELYKVLDQFKPLFNGNLVKNGYLGSYKGSKVHLELKPDSTPHHQRPYPVHEKHKSIFKKELDRLESIGVLSKTGPSEWLAPTFLIPKKDGRVRWISNFRELNKCIKRKVYTLPRIQDILKKRKGYSFFTKIDISMQYYTFELDEASKDLCTICTPFGNYKYNRLPMGIKQSPDIAQEIMEDLLRDLEETDVYIDDVGVFSDDWTKHLSSIQKVLQILQDKNFTVNPLKCEWGVQETDWLGHWLTPHGLKPWKKKVDPILQLEPPTTIKQLRSFIGMVTFYRDMFPRRSHLLAPLTEQVGKKTVTWTPACQESFDKIKAILAKDVFVRYPDHNKDFHIYCDASDYQLGAAILQEGVPVAYYSRKLTSAQKNYTVGEKELLSIVETLKEYRMMLYGAKLHVYTDHRNLTFNRLRTQRVIRWRLFLEEYAPQFNYIEGEKNVIADALSRLPFSERQNPPVDSQPRNPLDLYRTPLDDYSSIEYDPLQTYYSMAIDDPDLLDCFVHLPDQSGIPFVLDYETISQAQAQDAELQALVVKYPQRYVQQVLAPNVQVYCYIPSPNQPWKIYLPNELLGNAIRWYHLALSHVGITRLYDTMSMHFYNAKLKNRIEDIVGRCDTCQRQKLVGRGHGQTAPREAALLPWRDVAVDLIGPWTVHVGGHDLTYNALTIIDLVTNLVEVVRIDNKTAAHIGLLFENHWLSRYPLPSTVVYDQGGEFTGFQFQNTLRRHNIHGQPISSKNPQANSVCERMHQVIGNSLRALSTLNPPEGINDANQIMDTAIANAVFAHRASYSSALKTTPGGMAFGRDMILDLPLIADLQMIRDHRQQLIDTRLITANRKRFSYDYAVGDNVLKLNYKPKKGDPRAIGPYPVESVHTNGTLTIRLSPHVIERISIRRVKPYRI